MAYPAVSIQLLLKTTQQLVLGDPASLGSYHGVQANPFVGHGGKRARHSQRLVQGRTVGKCQT